MLIRTVFTRRRMLEWKTASEAERDGVVNLIGCYRTMWISPALAIGVAAVLIAFVPATLWIAAPILLAWLLAPFVAWQISQSVPKKAAMLSNEQTLFLHQMSRSTWQFFEKFVGPADNWLPPDNFQEYPTPVVAHRTSPTNIGMSLLANRRIRLRLCSRPGGCSIDRQKRCAMHRLERFHGHFLNWYTYRNLAALFPKYVSSVDSVIWQAIC